METIRYFTKDALQCFVYEDRGKMGKAAARDIIAMIHVMLSQKPVINMMFGAAHPRMKSWPGCGKRMMWTGRGLTVSTWMNTLGYHRMRPRGSETFCGSISSGTSHLPR